MMVEVVVVKVAGHPCYAGQSARKSIYWKTHKAEIGGEGVCDGGGGNPAWPSESASEWKPRSQQPRVARAPPAALPRSIRRRAPAQLAERNPAERNPAERGLFSQVYRRAHFAPWCVSRAEIVTSPPLLLRPHVFPPPQMSCPRVRLQSGSRSPGLLLSVSAERSPRTAGRKKRARVWIWSDPRVCLIGSHSGFGLMCRLRKAELSLYTRTVFQWCSVFWISTFFLLFFLYTFPIRFSVWDKSIAFELNVCRLIPISALSAPFMTIELLAVDWKATTCKCHIQYFHRR